MQLEMNLHKTQNTQTIYSGVPVGFTKVEKLAKSQLTLVFF